MPDLRAHKTIGERNDFRWFRRGAPLRRWYGRLSLLAVVLSAALVGAWTWQRDDRVYWSAPLSPAHASFQQDCRACHVARGAPLVRLSKFDEKHASVRDQDCQTCHAQQANDHSPRMIENAVNNCVTCHREHLAREKLAEVADQHCVACHANLAVNEGTPDYQHVPSFTSHPEFLPWREVLETSAVERRVKTHPLAVEEHDGRWQDRTKLRFNHAKHLVEVGVLTRAQTTDDDNAHSAGDRKQLDCRDCHQPDARGEYVLPISYEQHCAACHQLSPSLALALKAPLPHEKPELIFGQLRDRLMQYAEAHPERVTGQSEPPRLPNKQSKPTAKDKWDYVEKELEQETKREFGGIERVCAYCHTLAPGKPFEIVPPNIPNRWFTSSRFDHRPHAELSCVACHGEPGEIDGQATKLSSQATADILMPKLETCRTCHGGPAMPGRLSVRAACVDCHDYHSEHAQGGGKLDRWLKK